MTPPLALIGSGEYLPTMADIDRMLLARTGKSRPRVALIPTAAGREDPRRWTDLGSAHFASLGAEPVAVMAVDRASCDDPRWAQAVEEADLVYFSGGKPGYLADCMRGSALWAAAARRHAAGAVLAGSSAGAMLFGERTFAPDDFDEHGVPRAMGIVSGVALLRGWMVIAHFDLVTRDDELGRSLRPRFLAQVPPDARIVGVDEDTALLRLDGAWCVAGKGSVHLLRGPEIERTFPTGTVLSADLL